MGLYIVHYNVVEKNSRSHSTAFIFANIILITKSFKIIGNIKSWYSLTHEGTLVKRQKRNIYTAPLKKRLFANVQPMSHLAEVPELGDPPPMDGNLYCGEACARTSNISMGIYSEALTKPGRMFTRRRSEIDFSQVFTYIPFPLIPTVLLRFNEGL